MLDESIEKVIFFGAFFNCRFLFCHLRKENKPHPGGKNNLVLPPWNFLRKRRFLFGNGGERGSSKGGFQKGFETALTVHLNWIILGIGSDFFGLEGARCGYWLSKTNGT